MNAISRASRVKVDMEALKETAARTQYLTFEIAREEYAVDVLRVREIIEYDTLTYVPQTPRWVRGVINLRGSVVPVVDLATKFGLPESNVGPKTCIVLVEVELDDELMVIGVMADAVCQVIDLTPGDIEAPPAFGTGVRTDYVVGLGKLGKKFALLLDMNRVLRSELTDLGSFGGAAKDGIDEEDGNKAGSSTVGAGVE